MASNASIKRYKLSTFKLNALLEVTQTINENKSVDGLLKQYEKILKEDLSIGKILIFKKDDDWKCVLKSGLNHFNEAAIDVESVLMPFEEISFITTTQNEMLGAFDIVIPVVNNDQPLAYVLIGDIDEESEGVSPTIKHLNFIHTLSNIIIVAIENIRLFNQSLKQEAIRKELELASKMQSMLIPESSLLPNNEHISVSAFYHPHLEVGGDYYDCIKLNEKEYGFCIADVSGKGISAAILMSNFQANLRALFNQEVILENLVERLNERVIFSAKGEKFITLFLGRYNIETKELRYVNAGHNPPVMYNVEDKKLDFLKSGCVGVGMLDELPFVKKGSIILKHRTKLICYTDGLVELVGQETVETDTIEIEKCISNENPIEENIKTLILTQGVETGNQAIFDDISVLGLEFF